MRFFEVVSEPEFGGVVPRATLKGSLTCMDTVGRQVSDLDHAVSGDEGRITVV